MDNAHEPATKGDLAALEARIDARIGEQGSVLRSDMREQGAMLRSEMQHMYDDLKETIRDSETKLLQAFYSFTESNQKRISAIEAESSAIKSRLSTIEDRLTDVERRLNTPPPRP